MIYSPIRINVIYTFSRIRKGFLFAALFLWVYLYLKLFLHRILIYLKDISNLYHSKLITFPKWTELCLHFHFEFSLSFFKCRLTEWWILTKEETFNGKNTENLIWLPFFFWIFFLPLEANKYQSIPESNLPSSIIQINVLLKSSVLFFCNVHIIFLFVKKFPFFSW